MKRLQLFLLCVCAACLSAAAHGYMFRHLEVKDGLSNNQVNTIFKDSEGFMWFGTASGLNRYDGYGFKVYRSRSDDASSLPDNYIESIQEDHQGNLWIRTGAGYTIYNPATDTFDRNPEARMEDIGIKGTPSRIYIDAGKNLWISVTGRGVYRYKPGMEQADLVKISSHNLSRADITAMTECEEGILAVYDNGTLACLDGDKPDIKWLNDDIPAELGGEDSHAFHLFAAAGGKVWVYSAVGLWIYDLPQKMWEVRSPRNDTYNMVRAVAQDAHGCLWVGHDRDGIAIIGRDSTSTWLVNNPNNTRTVANNTITALYEDTSGTMWVGTYKKGVSYYNESAFKFALDDVGDINCVEDGGGDVVWLGTNGNGLIRWNTLTGERTTFTYTADPNSLSGDVVVSLLLDSRGRLWAGTFWGGLSCYDGQRFVRYAAREASSPSSACGNVWALAESDTDIWVGTLGGGLQCLDPQTGTFTTYSTANSRLPSDYVASLCVGRNHTLLIGTSLGVAFMNLDTREITALADVCPDSAACARPNVSQVYEDSRGLVWIAAREGLSVYDPAKRKLHEVPLKPDFARLFVLGIAEDDRHDMWASTGGELINIVLGTDSVTGSPLFQCRAYGEKDGLQGGDFNQRSLKRLHTGEMVSGGLYGLNRFHPDNIKYNRTPPRVMFTGFQLFNEDIETGRAYGGRVILPEELNRTEEVVLEYGQNVFTVLFASDNYVLPEKTRYFYKLEGFNDDWLPGMSDMHRVTYTNLSPGTYRLKVRATNSDGYAGTDEACLKIVILPPFWMTPWAYAGYALLLAGGLFLAFHLVRRREQSKFRMRQMEQDAKRAEELNQMKFRFFTNVSHELRTPLTLILSPLESMLKEATDTRMQTRLEMMHRNALRLLNLVNQLLDFRKNEMAGLHLSLSEGDVVAYVRNICSSFLMLSEKKNVHLTFFAAVESLDMAFDEDKMGKVVMNLLSNAFKFTPDGGRVDVSLEVLRGTPDMLELKVSDTGIGVKDEDKERIFERFFRVEREEGDKTTGSGIGLSLVRDYVALHGGTVRVFDNAGAGSVFIVDMPVRHSETGRHVPPSVESATGDTLPGNGEEETEEAARQEGRKRPVVLVVDDSEDLVAFMKDSLSLYFTVQTAGNGEEAWKMIPGLMPDLIVSDLMMPVMDGNELCRRVKADKRTRDIPFVLLTAKQSVEHKLEGLTLGADDYVTKPFNIEVLTLRMRKLIALSGRNRQRTHIDPEPSEIVITSLDEQLIANAVKYVEDNISRSDLSVEELSRELGMSRVHLYKRLLRITGKTPIEFIRVIRLKRAAQLLRESQLNVSEIAFQLGFNNPKYFSKYFKEEFGVLPSAYQEKS